MLSSGGSTTQEKDITMKIPALLGTVAVGATALIALGPVGAASADQPACDDAVAGLIHELHELAGPFGEPLHEVEEVYCSVSPS